MSRDYPGHHDECGCSGCYHSNVVEGAERRVTRERDEWKARAEKAEKMVLP